MNESQRRAFLALGIGPLWQRRKSLPPDEAVPADTGPRSLFLLPDETGDWLFVGEAQQADGAADVHGAVAPSRDSLRLPGRMLVALGLRPADIVLVGQRAAPDDERAAADLEAALAGRIGTIAPRVVVALGAGAAQALLRTDTPPAALRGRVHEATLGSRRVPVVVSWHPLQLLAEPQEKAGAWADLCLARDVLDAAAGGVPPPDGATGHPY